jgi:hypothetical protein
MKTKTPTALRLTGTLCLGIGLAGCIVIASPGQNRDSNRRETPLTPLPATLKLPCICRNPEADDYRHFSNHGAPLASLPGFHPENSFSVDLRSADASRLDLRNSAADLEHANFDSQTIWPPKDRLPPGFDAARVLELGKNPGLGVRRLHAQGITGCGIGIGIVDQTLLTRHSEFAARIKWYEEIDVKSWWPSQMHGPAVASIAVGKTVGVAPEADLFYIAVNTKMSSLLHNYALGVRRLLEINQRLPKERRIRAISLSVGYGPGTPGYDEFIGAVKEAEAEGIFVAWCRETARFPIEGLGVPSSADRDDFSAYTVAQSYQVHPNEGSLKVPMDSRTTASPTSVNDYAHYGPGGTSWTVPYAAGAYALTAQADPNITPEQFWSLAVKTGRRIQMKFHGQDVSVGPVLDMEALIKALAP